MLNHQLKTRIKTAHLVADLGDGGQERQLYNLVTNLPSDYLKLVIPWDFQLGDKYVELLKNKEDIIILDLGKKSTWAKLQAIRALLKETHADFLHSFSFHLNFAVWYTTLFLKVKAIGGVRSRLVSNRESSGILRFYLSYLFPFYRISNNYTCFSGLNIFTLLLGKALTDTKYVHNGIDTTTFSPFFESIKSKGNQLNTVSVGRLYPMKKVELIVDWVNEMRHLGFEVYHQHAGGGPELELLREKVYRLGIDNHFKFLGSVSDIPQLFASSDLFVHAAEYEGCPNVIMEAMSCGLPILSSNAGDISYIVDHGENGYVYEVGDLNSMLNFGIQFMKDRTLLDSFGSCGSEKAQKKFAVHTYVAQLKNAYREIGVGF